MLKLLQRAFSLSNFTNSLSFGGVAGLSTILCGLFCFRVLRRALERGHAEVSALRLELARMDVALAARMREVDEGKRRLEVKEKALQDVLGTNEALSVQLGNRDRELQRREEEMRQHVQTVQLLEAQMLDVKGTEAFWTKGDILSGEDVIAFLSALNSEIYQTAANVAEAFQFQPKSVEGTTRVWDEVDRWGEVHASATDMVGPQMVEILSSSEHYEDPSIVQVALQAAMAAYSNWIVRTWNLEDPEGDIGINRVYKQIRESEEQAVSGRWRALTRRHLPNTPEHELSLLFVDAFINILLVSSCTIQSHAELHQIIEARFSERVSMIVRCAQRLRKAIGEEIASCDFEVMFVNHDTPFSPTQMDDAFASGFEKGRQVSEPVLCTTELGLEKFERRSGKGGWDNTVLIRPKIALKSGIDEMMSAVSG